MTKKAQKATKKIIEKNAISEGAIRRAVLNAVERAKDGSPKNARRVSDKIKQITQKSTGSSPNLRNILSANKRQADIIAKQKLK